MRAPEPQPGPCRRRRSDKAMLESLRNFFRKYVLKNLALKLVSLAVAVLLWWVVGRDPTIEIPMTVPLEFHHAPDNLEMNSDSPLAGPDHDAWARAFAAPDQSFGSARGHRSAGRSSRRADLRSHAETNPCTSQCRSHAGGAGAVSHHLRSQRNPIGGCRSHALSAAC